MRITHRLKTFETNSSSVHSLVVVSEAEMGEIDNGNVFVTRDDEFNYLEKLHLEPGQVLTVEELFDLYKKYEDDFYQVVGSPDWLSSSSTPETDPESYIDWLLSETFEGRLTVSMRGIELSEFETVIDKVHLASGEEAYLVGYVGHD